MGYVLVINGRKVEGKDRDEALARQKKRNAGKLDEMLASRKAPGCETDDTYLSNFGTLLSQFGGDEHALKEHVKAAKEAGYTPGDNDVYIPTLAKFKGDPEAHISSRGDAVRLAEKRGEGLEINGRKVVESREPESDPWDEREILAEDLIQESLPDVMASDPTLSVADAREVVIEKHGAHEL